MNSYPTFVTKTGEKKTPIRMFLYNAVLSYMREILFGQSEPEAS